MRMHAAFAARTQAIIAAYDAIARSYRLAARTSHVHTVHTARAQPGNRSMPTALSYRAITPWKRQDALCDLADWKYVREGLGIGAGEGEGQSAAGGLMSVVLWFGGVRA